MKTTTKQQQTNQPTNHQTDQNMAKPASPHPRNLQPSIGPAHLASHHLKGVGGMCEATKLSSSGQIFQY